MNEAKWKKFIALNVRQCRLDAGLTQAALAAKVRKCTVPTISRIESGAHLPSLKTLLSLAEALGVDPCRLLEKPS